MEEFLRHNPYLRILVRYSLPARAGPACTRCSRTGHRSQKRPGMVVSASFGDHGLSVHRRVVIAALAKQ